jgi:hypothetical protein
LGIGDREAEEQRGRGAEEQRGRGAEGQRGRGEEQRGRINTNSPSPFPFPLSPFPDPYCQVISFLGYYENFSNKNYLYYL